MGSGLAGGPLTGGLATTLGPSATGTSLTLSDFLSLANGTAPLPSLRFTANPTDGFYSPSATEIALAIGGALAFDFNFAGGTTANLFGPGNPKVALTTTTASLATLVNSVMVDANLITFKSGTTLATWNVTTGEVSLSGTDSTGTPGNATISKASGKSAIAAGAATVTITNTLCAATSKLLVTFHARDATGLLPVAVPGAGSFTVTTVGNCTAALPFSWEVSTVI